MLISSRLRSLYVRYLSKPKLNRPAYRAIHRHGPKKIVELGVGDGRRALQMIKIATQSTPRQDIHYVGIDLFEDQPASSEPGLPLKAAYQLLRGTGARVQLIPGDPPDALMQHANSLGKVDLLVISAKQGEAMSSKVWFFVPRLLHAASLVYVEETLADGQRALCFRPRDEIDRLATVALGRRAA